LEKTVVRGGDKTRKLEYVGSLLLLSLHYRCAVVNGLFLCLNPIKDTMVKIRQCVVEEKKDVRFGNWSAAEVKIIHGRVSSLMTFSLCVG